MNTFFSYFVFGLTFDSSVELTDSEPIGLHAKQFTYPANVETHKTELQIVFVNFDAESQTNMKMSDAELISYVKSTFLGTGKEAESKKERTIMGTHSTGEILTTKIPVASKIELHLITLFDKIKTAVAFKSINTIKPEVLESLISEITGSINLNR